MNARNRAISAVNKLRYVRDAVSEAGDWNDAVAVQGWLRAAADLDPDGASRREFRDAVELVEQWRGEVELTDKVARAYHDPRIRAAFGEKAIQEAWADPARAYQRLIKLSAAGKLGREGYAALDALGAVRAHIESTGGTWAPVEQAVPTGTALETEYRELISKEVREGRLTEAEYARRRQLAEARVPKEDERAAIPQGGTSDRTGEYWQLIRRNDGSLKPAEQARLRQLSEARAVADGQIIETDFTVENDDE